MLNTFFGCYVCIVDFSFRLWQFHFKATTLYIHPLCISFAFDRPCDFAFLWNDLNGKIIRLISVCEQRKLWLRFDGQIVFRNISNIVQFYKLMTTCWYETNDMSRLHLHWKSTKLHLWSEFYYMYNNKSISCSTYCIVVYRSIIGEQMNVRSQYYRQSKNGKLLREIFKYHSWWNTYHPYNDGI